MGYIDANNKIQEINATLFYNLAVMSYQTQQYRLALDYLHEVLKALE